METPLLAIENGRFMAATQTSLPAGIQPGWIDAHCHILPTGLDLLKLNLRPAKSREEVLEMVKSHLSQGGEGWLLAVHYDQTKFERAKHLSRDELDSLSSSRPILLRHSNGHASVANSAALAAAGISEDTPDPRGGEFCRDSAGRLNGVLLERAHEIVTSSAPEPELEEMVEAILRAGSLMASFGITCATDMMTGRWNLARELEAYRIASERGCGTRLRLCMQWREVMGEGAIEPGLLEDLLSAMNPDLCKVIGVKVFADGAIGSATAAIHGRYKTTGGQGKLIYSPEKLTEIVTGATKLGWGVTVHSIGDRSTDHVMDAFEASGEASRHRLEHAMILSDEQIGRLAKLGCPVSFQPEFLHRFGHAYRVQLEDQVWPLLKRCRSVLDAGIRISFNTDRPIVEGIPEVGIETAVSRPEGFDPSENVTKQEAEAAWTTGAAWANGDHASGGVIAPGAWADFRVVSEDGTLQETWMGGRQTWKRGTSQEN